MQTKLYQTGIVEIIDNEVVIRNVDDALSLFCTIDNCTAIILKKENFTADFFKLSTGIAGEILQKFSTYRMKMAIVGNFDNLKSKPLHDFIFESNKTRHIIFVKTTEEALKIFST